MFRRIFFKRQPLIKREYRKFPERNKSKKFPAGTKRCSSDLLFRIINQTAEIISRLRLNWYEDLFISSNEALGRVLE